MCANRNKQHLYRTYILRQRLCFCESEDEKGTVERKHRPSFHFISLSFSFSSSRLRSVSLSPYTHAYTCREILPLTHRSTEWSLENRRSWLAAERQEACLNNAGTKVCGPVEKSRREMPGSSHACIDLKVGARGKSAVEGRRKKGCHAARVWYSWSSAYKQRLLKLSLHGTAGFECIISRKEKETQKGFGTWNKYYGTCRNVRDKEVRYRTPKQTKRKQHETLQHRQEARDAEEFPGITLQSGTTFLPGKYRHCHWSSIAAEIQGSSQHASPSPHVGGRVIRGRYPSLTQAENSRSTLVHCTVVVSMQCGSFEKRSRHEATHHHLSTWGLTAYVGVLCLQWALFPDVQSNQKMKLWRLCSVIVWECFHEFGRSHKKTVRGNHVCWFHLRTLADEDWGHWIYLRRAKA